MIFLSKYLHKINAKNQVTIPSRHREMIKPEELCRGLYVVPGKERCLYLYTLSGLEAIASSLREDPATSADFRRMLFASSARVECDDQGRILIPAAMKELAGIDREVLFVGNTDRIEMWAPGEWGPYWERHRAEYEKRYQQVADQIFK